MKLINKTKSNYYTIDTYVMRGTVIMTKEESQDVYDYLQNAYKIAKENCVGYTRDCLYMIKDFDFTKKKSHFSLGIHATQLVVDRFNLKGYKDQNYGFVFK